MSWADDALDEFTTLQAQEKMTTPELAGILAVSTRVWDSSTIDTYLICLLATAIQKLAAVDE